MWVKDVKVDGTFPILASRKSPTLCPPYRSYRQQTTSKLTTFSASCSQHPPALSLQSSIARSCDRFLYAAVQFLDSRRPATGGPCHFRHLTSQRGSSRPGPKETEKNCGLAPCRGSVPLFRSVLQETPFCRRPSPSKENRHALQNGERGRSAHRLCCFRSIPSPVGGASVCRIGELAEEQTESCIDSQYPIRMQVIYEYKQPV